MRTDLSLPQGSSPINRPKAPLLRADLACFLSCDLQMPSSYRTDGTLRNSKNLLSQHSEKVSASREKLSGFPETGLTSGEVRETSGEVRATSGKSGKLPGNPWIAVKFHSERTSGEVAEKLPGSSGDFPEARGSLTPSQRLAKFVFKTSQLRFSRHSSDTCQASSKPTTVFLCTVWQGQ